MTGHLGLYTDLYELRMVSSYLRRGMTQDATFSLYIRPTRERPWFVAFGVAAVLAFVERFSFGPSELAYLRSIGIDEPACRWLASFRPCGEIAAVPDGTIVLANEPIVEVTAPLPVAQLLETGIINRVHHGTLIATKAARVAIAAEGRPVVDFGFRRAHGLETGVDAALAAYVGGGLSTSNVEAGRRHEVPVAGTMAHSYVQAHPDELSAFRAFAEDHPYNCVLLVDTYDTIQGVRNAITVAREMASRGRKLRAIRLDSGDIDALARAARDLLDEAGFDEVQVFASGGLDEVSVAAILRAGAPVDAFGVGTDLVVSRDRPALDIAYKLVRYDGRDVYKASTGKRTLPGPKQVFRTSGPPSDVLGLRDEDLPGDALLGPVWRDGSTLQSSDLHAVRDRVREQLATLPDDWKRIEAFGNPPVPRLSPALAAIAG